MLPDQEPEAAHAVVFVELQVKVDDPPEDIESGLAEKLIVGGGTNTPTVTGLVSLPDGPVQVKV